MKCFIHNCLFFIFIEKDLLWKIFDKKAEMRYPSWKTFLSQSDTVESDYR